MTSLASIPAWYWALALLLSSYFAFRGFVGHWYAQRQNATLYPRWVIIWVFCVHDALFHFVSAVSGFVAWFAGFGLYESMGSAPVIDAGRSVLLVFCVLFGLVGVTGQLPQLILQGKLPAFK